MNMNRSSYRNMILDQNTINKCSSQNQEVFNFNSIKKSSNGFNQSFPYKYQGIVFQDYADIPEKD